MPSPTSSTVPTERVSAPTSKASMADLMMLVMSWERRAMGGILLEGARGEPAPQPLQAASDTPVDQAVAEPHDDAAEQARIDVRGQLDAAAGELLDAGRHGEDLLDEAALARRGERLADDLAGGPQGQIGDLAADLGQGTVLLRGDLGRGLHAHALQLGARDLQLALAGLIGHLLGPIEDLLRLAPGVGQGGGAPGRRPRPRARP